MNRRDSVLVILSFAVAPLRAFSQQPGRVWRVGYLSVNPQSSLAHTHFLQGMRELGYPMGRRVPLLISWSNSHQRLIRATRRRFGCRSRRMRG